jgi:hypothetical protein
LGVRLVVPGSYPTAAPAATRQLSLPSGTALIVIGIILLVFCTFVLHGIASEGLNPLSNTTDSSGAVTILVGLEK